MSGKLARKRKVRTGHRVSTRKIISSVEEILETLEEQDQPSAIITRLRQQKLLLQEKLDTIRKLDEDILAVVSEDQIDEEICEADEFMEFTQLAIMRIDAALTPSQLTPSSRSPGNVSMASETHIRNALLNHTKCLDGFRSSSDFFYIAWKFLSDFGYTLDSFHIRYFQYL